MSAFSDNFTFIQNNDFIRMADGADALGDDDFRHIFFGLFQSLTQSAVGFEIKGGEGIVKD